MPPELTSPPAASTGARDLTLSLTPASLVTAGGGGPRASEAGGRLGDVPAWETVQDAGHVGCSDWCAERTGRCCGAFTGRQLRSVSALAMCPETCDEV